MTRGAVAGCTLLRRMALVVLLTVVGSVANGAWGRNFYFYNNANERVAFCTGSNIPDDMRSPLVTQFYYYTSTPTDNDFSGGSTALPGGDGDVYVKYDYDKTLFSGYYSFKLNNTYVYSSGNALGFWGASASNIVEVFTLAGDPYSLKVQLYSDESKVVSCNNYGGGEDFSLSSSNTYKTFIILTANDGAYTLRVNEGASSDTYDSSNGSYWDSQSNNLRIYRTSYSNGKGKKITFQPVYNYYVVNKSGNIALQKIGDTGTTMPSELKSPLISDDNTYKLFSTQSDAANYNSDPENTEYAAKAITSASESPSGNVYIGYSYVSSASDIIDLSGETGYKIQINNGNYFYAYNNNNYYFNNYGRTSAEGYSSEYVWHFSGNDPYAILVSPERVFGTDKETGTLEGTYYFKKNNVQDAMRRTMNFTANGAAATADQYILKLYGESSGVTYYNLACVSDDSKRNYDYLFFLAEDGSSARQNRPDKYQYIYTSDRNNSRLTFKKVFPVTFHFRRRTGNATNPDDTSAAMASADAFTQVYYFAEGQTLTLEDRTRLVRPSCTLSASYYTDAACTTTATTATSSATDIYVPYSFNAVDLKEKTGLEFSDDDSDPTWLLMYFNSGQKYLYQFNGGISLAYAQKTSSTATSSDKIVLTRHFALIGDPYSAMVINREAKNGNAYIPAALSSNSLDVYMQSTNTNSPYWSVVAGNNGYVQISPRWMHETSANRYYWNPSGGAGVIKLYQVGANNSANDILFEKAPIVRTLTYHVVRTPGVNPMVVETVEDINAAAGSATPELPDATRNASWDTPRRYLCEYQYWADPECTVPIPTVLETTSDIYVTYTWPSTAPIQFSPDFEHAKWYKVRMDQNTSNWMYYNPSNNGRLNFTSSPSEDYAYFAFIGDAYGFRVVNMYTGEGSSAEPASPTKGQGVFMTNTTDENYWTVFMPSGSASSTEKVLQVCASSTYHATSTKHREFWNNNSGIQLYDGNSTYYLGKDNDVYFEPATTDFYPITYVMCDTEGNEVGRHTDFHASGASIAPKLPAALKRAYCDYGEETLYDQKDGTTLTKTYADLPTTMPASILCYYAQYSLTEKGTKLFSGSTWFRIKNNYSNYFSVNDDSRLAVGTLDSENTTAFEWSFTGTPYDFQIASRKVGMEGQYVQPVALTNGSAIRVNADNDALSHWEAILPFSGDKECAIIQKDSYYGRSYLGSHQSLPTLTVTGTQIANYDLIAVLRKNYMFNIVDTKGHIAIKHEGEWFEDGTLTYYAIPEDIRSPYLYDETITCYKTIDAGTADEGYGERLKYTLSDVITNPMTIAEGGNIYVTYTVANLALKAVNLVGTAAYNMQVNKPSGNAYLYDNNGAFAIEATDDNTDKRNRMWYLQGSDPYAITVENSESSRYFKNPATIADGSKVTLGTGSDVPAYFILMPGNDNSKNNQIRLMVATGDDYTTEHYHLGRQSGMSLELYDHNTGYTDVAIQILLSLPDLGITYNVVDKQNKIVLQVNTHSSGFGLPTEWQSPMVSQYHYWKKSQFTLDDVDNPTTFTNPTGGEVTALAQVTDGNIYVTYDVITNTSDANYVDLNQKVYTDHTGSDGNGLTGYKYRQQRSETATTMVRDADSWGVMYRLEFTSSDSYRLEDGSDNVMADATASGTHIYPYTNGDGPIYIRTEAKWEEEKDGGASTRTRWPWFLLSQYNDPYHVMITSWQQSHARSGTNYYSFLRTYYNTTLNQVVTNNISDDPNTVGSDNEASGVAAGSEIVPTEYMLLNGNGTTGKYKLLTTDQINGQHQTVTSFEQYWRNNPTAQRTVGASVGSGTLTTAQENTLKNNYGWHKYGHYANATPWEGGSKSYEPDDHWFMTVNVGDGSFNLQPTELNAVLILIDNHGWEIMRQNIYKQASQQANYNASKTVLKKWDSPMVKQYRYYINGTKQPGYHKYTVAEDQLQETTTSLGDDYPQSYSGGMLRDLYVTYEVSDEYAGCYTGAATEGETSATAFLVQQGANFAVNTSGTTLTTQAVASTNVWEANDASGLLWKVKPNFNIDDEMAYEYDDEVNETLSKAETLAGYVGDGKARFDPYNVQIQNTKTGNYLKLMNVTGSTISGGHWENSYSSAGAAVGLSATLDATSGEGYDNTTLRMTNATFMVIDDGAGNMRLMPRFDHSRVVQAFTTLTTQAATQSANDQSHNQTTLFKLPYQYTYIVNDLQGREAVRFMSHSEVKPQMQAEFRSPLAKNFTFYSDATYTNKITTLAGAAAILTEGKIYVKYEYDAKADGYGLLKGAKATMQVAEADVKYDNAIKSATGKDATQTAWQWRLQQNAKGTPDPYAVTLFNIGSGSDPMSTATLGSGTFTANSGGTYQRFVLLDYAGDNNYALMLAGTQESASAPYTYYYVNGSNLTTGATTTAKSADGELTTTEKIHFNFDVVPTSVTYKLITNTGKVALQTTVSSFDAKYTADGNMPAWMKTPLMTNDAYFYCTLATGSDADGWSVDEDSWTQTLLNLEGNNVVFVRYDYETSKTAFSDFRRNSGQIFNAAPLDLSGGMSYYLTLNVWNWYDNGTYINGKQDTDGSMRFHKTPLWRLTGNDPYEIQFVNVNKPDQVLGAPAMTGAASNSTGENVVLCNATDDSYPHKTFMVLKGANNNLGLKLYVTGSEILYLSEATAIKIFKDNTTYHERRANNSEAQERQWGGYNNFYYRPAILYHIITNEGQEALMANSYIDRTTAELPQYLQSPLLASSDFRYYTEANKSGELWTITETEEKRVYLTDMTLAQAAQKGIGEVWVRYTYDPDTSPFAIASGFDATSATKLDWGKPTRLMLDGSAWYNLAIMQQTVEDPTIVTVNASNTNRFDRTKLSTVTGKSNSLSAKKYLWKFEGNDPYAIRVYHALSGNKCLSISTGTTANMENVETVSNGYPYQTFMFLGFVASDNNETKNTGYSLKRWNMLVPTAPNAPSRLHLMTFYASSESNGTIGLGQMAYDNTSTNSYSARMEADEIVQREYITSGGNSSSYNIEFVKAPTGRRYHYYAINQQTSEVAWDAVLMHDWMSDIVLDDDIARLYTKYEHEYLSSGGDSDDFGTRSEVEARNNAQFYSDAALTTRVSYYDSDQDITTYDVYPDYDAETEYPDGFPIYFKYQPMTNDEIKASAEYATLPFLWSSAADVADDVADRKKNGKLTDETKTANWFFMVLDTDEGITATGTPGVNRTLTGRQYFLRREDNGIVDWMDNAFALHKERTDNFHNYTYSRLAESFRVGENVPFREPRWLWAFVGDDPYNVKLINMESAVGVTPEGEGVYKLEPYDNCWTTISEQTTATTIGDKTTYTTSYPVTVPTTEPTTHFTWGLTAGYEGETTMSLLSSGFKEQTDEGKLNRMLYWSMVTDSKTSADSVAGTTRTNDRTQSIQLLPYEPVRYENLRIVIRRDDKVAGYVSSHPKKLSDYSLPEEMADYMKQMRAIDALPTGTVRLYSAEDERTFVAGDVLDVSDPETLPIDMRRAFCDYTFYNDDFRTSGNYVVKVGPARGEVQRYPADYAVESMRGQIIFNDEGMPMYNYYAVYPADVTDAQGNIIHKAGDWIQTGTDGSGNPIYQGAPPQSIYVQYKVTSDIFLKQHPTKAEVAQMKANNDHVYFMDFPDPKMLGSKPEAYNTGHHAYFDQTATFRDQIGNLQEGVKEKRKWNSSTKEFEDDNSQPYNFCQYKTTENRMTSVPENLKWYFVGDPYAVQVYNTNSEFADPADGTTAANLARFDPTETRFQFVVDCVHLRIPDLTIIDERKKVDYTDERGTVLETLDNENYGKPYYAPFYWEMVPTPTDVEGGFALRFHANNQVLGYRNVYYYLSHDGLTRIYRTSETEDNRGSYAINLSYRTDNARHLSGKYRDYHEANNDTTVIRLIQPAKLYVSAYKDDGDHTFKDGNRVTREELSEYFGVGETLTEVPRHLQRKYVNYSGWQFQKNNDSTSWYDTGMGFLLDADKTSHAYNMEECTDETGHPIDEWMFTTDGKMNKGTPREYTPVKRASYKLRVLYEVDDVTNPTAAAEDQIHLFSPSAADPQWLDVMVGNANWLYYDKTNVGGTPSVENQTSLVSNYRRAMSQGKTGWNNEANGWADGIKGLHWAFIGDPYDFTILNRRRSEDAGSSTSETQWLAVTKKTIADWKSTTPNDSVIWTTGLVSKTAFDAATATAANTTASLADNAINTHFSLQMTKTGSNLSQTGNADNNFFLRTASLKNFVTETDDGLGTPVGDYSNDQTSPGSNQTNNYWRMVAKLYPDGGPYTSFFEIVPFALSDKDSYNGDQTSTYYSRTMSGLGLKQQLLTIRTVTDADNDGAANDCFDANVRIYSLTGEHKATLKHVEVAYKDVFQAMPPTLRRYGCTYTDCFQLAYDGYTDDMVANPTSENTKARTVEINTRLQNLNNFTSESSFSTGAQRVSFVTAKQQDSRFSDASIDMAKIITDINGRRYIEIAYVYTVDEEVEKYFTTPDEAKQDEYTWTNPYFNWEEVIKGSKSSYVDYQRVFDHYVYGPDGHIIDEVYVYQTVIRDVDGSLSGKPFYGWVNTHAGQQSAYGNETSQSEDDRQKWSLIGDPYGFEMKNYSKYLQTENTVLIGSATAGEPVSSSTTTTSHWTMMQGKQKEHVNDEGKLEKVTDASGNPVYEYYLALIDDDPASDTYGMVIRFITFDRNDSYTADQQNLYSTGGVNFIDPTGRKYDANGVKPFYLSELMSYANLVVYHLVIAHQHSRNPLDLAELQADDYGNSGFEQGDYSNDAVASGNRYNKKVWSTINSGEYEEKNYNVLDHLAEWDWYNNRKEGKLRADYPLTDTEVSAMGDTYVKPSSLRDVVSDPIPDYIVQRVGIGNRLTMPWYMKRQFCNYTFYQRDVMKSLTMNGSNEYPIGSGSMPKLPACEEADDSWTGATTTIDGIKYKVDASAPYAVTAAETTDDRYVGCIQRTFEEDGETKRTYQIRWVSVLKTWKDGTDPESAKPKGYDDIEAHNDQRITKLDKSHENRMVVVDVVYHVDPKEFRFAQKGRNTTAWYSMMTNNAKDGLMNFSYKDGIGARHGREKHYTNNYLWAPEGDPYGFILHSRYATINGTGWDNVVVTTPGKLPTTAVGADKIGVIKNGDAIDYSVKYSASETLAEATVDQASYTGQFDRINFRTKRITHPGRNAERRTWSARNAIYEMFVGMNDYSFLMHPTSAYVDHTGDKFSSFYMIHNTTPGTDYHEAELRYIADAKTLRLTDADANWRLMTTPEQLLPYFERAGYVGGLQPNQALHYENRTLYDQLLKYKATYQTNPSVIDFQTIDRARELVYKGKFYRRGGAGNPYTTELLYTEDRPKDNADDMPLKFVPDNLIPLTQGYYRIQAFSDEALNKDGENVDNRGLKGVVGPRYISGYRHESEKQFAGFEDLDNDDDTPMTLKAGSRWLHFYETDEAHTVHHVMNDMHTLVSKLDGANYHDRDAEPHPAMRGNIEILPAEYDPSSIFYFTPADVGGDEYDRWNISTQGLRLRGRAGGRQGVDATYGVTKLVEPTAASESGYDDHFRINDIGGTAFTMRLRKYAIGDTKEGTSTALSTWDDIVAENLKTNYLCIDANHRYRITIHKDNEMKEIGDGYAEGAAYWQLPDINYGIQDTKWLLQPVGVRTEWPYNEMPLRVKVNKGGQKPDLATGLGLSGSENEDPNYYASLYVPFDTRLNSTIDAAFTATVANPMPKALRLASVSQLNNMGNPQFIPAAWPVVIRSSATKTGQWMTRTDTNGDGIGDGPITEDPAKAFRYVELYIPTTHPTDIPDSRAKITLHGSYLETMLSDDDIDTATGKSSWSNGRDVMVLGLPFVQGTNDKTTTGEAGENKSTDYYAYQTTDAVGFYTNENWRRDQRTGDDAAAGATIYSNTANAGTIETAHWATARNATYQQRSNRYVYHNKAFYVGDFDPAAPHAGETPAPAPARPFYALLFDDEEYEQPDEPQLDEQLTPDVPQTGVYDISGRLLRSKETVADGTWRRDLPPGVYIVNGRKVMLK